MRTVRRRLLASVLALAAVAVLVFAVLSPPERCPDVTRAELQRSATAAVDWFVRNQEDDGRWLYLYNADTGEAATDYNVVRHMGVQMSLYQAASAGISAALQSAERGLTWSFAALVDVGDGSAVRRDGRIAVGASALLVAGLAERRSVTGDRQYDDVLRRLGTFLAAQTEESGAVLAYYDPAAGRPVPGEYSKYYTGEAYWALTRLHLAFPGEGWGRVADRVGSYLATDRDRREGYRLPLPDHWAAYGLSETARFGDRPASAPLTDDEAAHVRRQAGLFAAQVRWLSQQAGHWGPAVRGTRELRGGGYGVIGEALTGLWIAARSDDRLADLQQPLASRARCIAGLAMASQFDAGDAGGHDAPGRVEGAWFAGGETRMDDQQHALSAILRTMPIVEAGTPSDGDGDGSVPSAWLWLAALVAVSNPFRLVSAIRGGDRPPGEHVRLTAIGVLIGFVVAFAASLAGDPLLDALNITDSAMRISAGIVAGLAGVVTFLRRPPAFEPSLPGLRAAVVPVAVPMVAGAALLMTAVGAYADRGVGPLAGAAVVAVVSGSLIAVGAGRRGRPGAVGHILIWAGRLTSGALIVVAVQLVIDGVLGV